MTETPNAEPRAWVEVWDPFVRIGHWLLVAAVATALITRGEPEWLHQGAGYVIAAYVIWRVMWGIAGPESARFETFLRSPLDAISYLANLFRAKAQRHIGHSPAGGWMIAGLLLALSATVASGLAMENRIAVPAVLAPFTDSSIDEEREPGEAQESPWEEIHEAFANLVLALALLHLVGVALASIAHRENLTRAMVDGRKRPDG